MRILQSINQSVDAIRANAVRAGLTIFIILLGITALIVVMTSIEGIKQGLGTSFSALGSNTFRVLNRASSVQVGKRGRDRRKRFPPISYLEARDFQESFSSFATVSMTGSGGGTNRVKFRTKTTNPNIYMMGTDEYYMKTARFELDEGRTLSTDDVKLARNVVVLGAEVKKTLFPFESAIGHTVSANGHSYRVVGVYKSQGSSSMAGPDKTIVIPISTLRAHSTGLGSLSLNVYVEDAKQLDYVMEEARGAFRQSRSLKVTEDDNFSLVKSDEFVEQLMEQLSVLTIAAQIIAIITLLGASVALLNVMLVSVTERTNEIGLRKAVGSPRKSILYQFLTEAVVICQIGGVAGIIVGIMLGNVVSNLAFDINFVIPWNWVAIGVVACLVVGVGAGYYPAWKAAKVDPIESLRHI
ncbi:MAG: ABC transporter permease [Bacteroidota bacterium]